MKPYTAQELANVLAKHIAWLQAVEGGERADLSGADLSGANLSGANLSGADLSGADLSSADLSSANLRSADLSGADLSGADLSGADLRSADLSGADLSSANLSGADLRSADLSGADLRSANLSSANLSSADLSGADLRSADLDLTNPHALLAHKRTRILPDGDLIGWKKATDGEIIKLQIPAHAKRSHTFGRKCRASEVLVLQIFDGDKEVARANTRQHGPQTVYEVGKVVLPDKFEDDWMQECAPGIHFYITREEALAH